MKQFKKITLLLIVGLFGLISFGYTPSTTEASTLYKIGHLWKFTYNHDSKDLKNISGEVAVQVVKYNRSTLDVVKIYSEDLYDVPCAENGSGGIDCELDIQGNINESYANAGVLKYAPSTEAYNDFIVEAIGSWIGSIPNGATLASHPTLEYGLETKGSRGRFLLDFAGNNAKGKSEFYKPVAGETYRMTTLFVPTQTNQKVTYSVEELSSGKSGEYGSETLPTGADVDFMLSPSTLTITVPSGFDLETFIIDPPKFGNG